MNMDNTNPIFQWRMVMLALLTISGVFAHDKRKFGDLEIEPKQTVQADTLRLSLDLKNTGEMPVVFWFSKTNVFQFAYTCESSGSIEFHRNYDDVPKCKEYLNDSAKYISEHGKNLAPFISSFCSRNNWERKEIKPLEKNEVHLKALHFKKTCDSKSVVGDLNEDQFEILRK
jgi:hypothetical protein